jgi:hypothetical protein
MTVKTVLLRGLQTGNVVAQTLGLAVQFLRIVWLVPRSCSDLPSKVVSD